MNFEKIWLDYQASLKAFLHSRISNRDDVDDLLQNIMIKIYEKRHSVKSESSLKSWLFQVANNTIIGHYRKKQKEEGIKASDLWQEEAQTDSVLNLADCIHPFILALPSQSAKLLTEIDINGQSQKEYAASLGLSYSTLKSRVQKARNQLRILFEDCCYLYLDANGSIIDYEPKSDNCNNC